MKRKILFAVIIPILVILVAVAGVGAVTGFQFWQGQTNVTVLEGMTVTKISDTGGTWDNGTKTWTITGLKAGESRSITFQLTNTATSGSLMITPLSTPSTYPGFTLAWTGDIDAGGTLIGFGVSKSSTFTITANGDCPTGTSYVFVLTYSRS